MIRKLFESRNYENSAQKNSHKKLHTSVNEFQVYESFRDALNADLKNLILNMTIYLKVVLLLCLDLYVPTSK